MTRHNFYAMKKYLLLILILLPVATIYAQQLIVIPEDTDTLQNNYTIVAPDLEDYTFIDSLGNKSIRMDEWRLACRDYRFQKRMQEETLEENKGGKISGMVLFTLGFRSNGSAAGVLLQLKRKLNPWGFLIKVDGLILEESDKQLVFQQTPDGTIYADRNINDNGAVFGFGVSKKYSFITPFVIYNFGTMRRTIEWVDYSSQKDSYAITGLQLGAILDVGRLNVMGSYTFAGDYLSCGIGFEIR